METATKTEETKNVLSHFRDSRYFQDQRKTDSRKCMQRLNNEIRSKGWKFNSFIADEKSTQVIDYIQKTMLCETGIKPTIKYDVINAIIHSLMNDPEKMAQVLNAIESKQVKEDS